MSLKERLELLYDSFSLRHRNSPVADDLPELTNSFRTRVLLLWSEQASGTPLMRNTFGHDPFADSLRQEMHNAMQHLYGRQRLGNVNRLLTVDEDLSIFLNECSTAEFFDFMELLFKLPSTEPYRRQANDQVDAFNSVFRIEALPYEMTAFTEQWERTDDMPGATRLLGIAYPKVIRVDEQVPHREAIQPALAALSASHFKEANDEFLKALVHYRDDELPDCLTACGSALDSVLKVICDQKKWAYDDQKTLASLLDTVIDRTSLEPFFKSMLMVVGTIRNRLSSAHGKGTKDRSVPRHIAQYALTSTAAAIVLLITETGTDH